MAKRKISKKQIEIIISAAVVALAAIAAVYSCFFTKPSGTEPDYGSSNLVMTAIDVGQGDSILITQGQHALLIDAGTNDSQEKLVNYIQSQKIRRFDYVIATHPHADHIGGMDKIIENFEIDNFLMPELPDNMIPSTNTYEKMVSELIDRDVNVIAAQSGQSYNAGEMKLDILAPVSADHDDLNNFSAVVRLAYKDTVIMLTGDSEKDVEKELLASEQELSCDIYKVGHHGSDSSSSKKFLDAMNPRYAVISCGYDNSYNHPSEKTLRKLEERQIEYFVTKECGTVKFICDGKSITVKTEKGVEK